MREPAIDGWQLSAHYHPAAGGRVGGDWYDAFQLDSDELVVVVGDVAGHGVGAAGPMTVLREDLRNYLRNGASPVAAVERLNEFSVTNLPGTFATVVIARIDVESGHLSAVLAGHPVPVIVADDAAPQPAPFATSPPVGVPGARYTSSETTLPLGSVLVLFSDGLVERRDEDLSDSFEHLIEQLGRLGRAASAAAVFDAVRRDGSEDDATVLTVERLHFPEHCSHNGAVLAQM